MSEKGSSIPLIFHEDETVKLNTSKFKTLLKFVIDNSLSNVHLSYICDCLTLSEDLEADEPTRELIFRFADPEINGGYVDKEELLRIISTLE